MKMCDQSCTNGGEVTRLRETVKRLNRRCQSAESGLAAKAEALGDRSMGRVFANAAASMYHAQLEELKAQRATAADPELLERLRRALTFGPKALAVPVDVDGVRTLLELLGGAE